MTDVVNHPGEPELWGGPEATVNRVGDRYFDQLVLTDHDARDEDLDRIASLGIRTVRYPVLWERTAGAVRGEYRWTWPDARLQRLQDLGIEPIVGLVHHGSGPRWTNLLSDDFADALAEYAALVAARYPHVRRYTIVNEPLTTARFAGLYGHWYPHRKDDAAFVRALLVQCRAIVMSMQAIHRLTPSAELVQTEDIGRTFARSGATRQAAFYNERRWLTYDLLCGRVTPDHPLWDYLGDSGARTDELEFFLDNPTPPDIFGVNYYVTSDRFLDDRCDRYPPDRCHRSPLAGFVDVEAARSDYGLAGHQQILTDVWCRFQRPVALTEVHLACTREEQVRWLLRAWQAACDARRAGIPVRAVTAWSLFGAVDWDSLVTESRGHYEPGAFDVRGGQCRMTALGHAIRCLSTGRMVIHPAVRGIGWWDRWPQPPRSAAIRTSRGRQPLLITGATGTLGQELARACETRGIEYCVLNREALDIADPAAVREALHCWKPWAVVNAAGYVRVDQAQHDAARCWRENVEGASVLAAAAAEHRVAFLTYSSDLVFDGRSERPYVERDPVGPLSVYGRSKAAAETAVIAAHSAALVVRTAAFFGPHDRGNFVTCAIVALAAGEPIVFSDSTIVSPTYVPDLATASVDLLIDGASGLWHLTNEGQVSFAECARRAARLLGLNPEMIRTVPDAMAQGAPRPRYSALATERGAMLRPLDEALELYASALDSAHWHGRSGRDALSGHRS